MVDIRTLLAAVLGVGLGLFFVAFPEAVVQMQTAGRRPSGRSGEYGTDSVSGRWRRIVQVVGVVIIGVGLYFTATIVG